MFVCEEIPVAANDNAVGHGDRNKNAPERVCVGCAIVFKRKGNSKDAAKYCSRECAVASGGSGRPRLVTAENRKLAESFVASFSAIRCKCVDCSVWFYAKSIQAQRCEQCLSAHRQRLFDLRRGIDRSQRECLECKETFIPPYGRGQSEYCSSECGIKRSRRIARSRRRALERGAANDNFDPLDVLERDGWRCKFCGIKTPKMLRGTIEPNAPELDHIVPITKGGEHSARNTQCLCRSCNGDKSNNILGQLRLFG